MKEIREATTMNTTNAVVSRIVFKASEPPSVPSRSLKPRMTAKITAAMETRRVPKTILPSTNQKTASDLSTRLRPRVKSQVTAGRNRKSSASSMKSSPNALV